MEKNPSPPPLKAEDSLPETVAAIYPVRAIKLFDKISLKDVRKIFSDEKIQPAPQGFVVAPKPNSFLFIFRFGCVAFFNMTEEDATLNLNRLKEVVGNSLGDPALENYEVRSGESVQVEFEYVQVKRITRDHVALTCLTVAQSAALEFLERTTDSILENSTNLFGNVAAQGRLPFDLRRIVKTIGGTANTRQEIISKLAILDAPDETWKSKELDKLYRDVRDNFEIDIRFRALDRKLTLVQDNLELLADMANYQRANFLEMLILMLIFIEIILGLTGILRR